MFDKRKDQARSTQTPSPAAGGPASESPRTTQAPKADPAMIGTALLVSGELSGDEDVVVAGRFQGKISLPKNSLMVSKGGHVEADVAANAVQIEGRVAGDIRCADKVLITATGQMEGTIVAPRVILVDGAKFKGSIDMDPPAETKKPAAQTRPPQTETRSSGDGSTRQAAGQA